MIFTNPVKMFRPISFARRDADSLICAWHFSFASVDESIGFLPLPSSDGRVIDMDVEPNLILRLAACAPRRTVTGNVFRYNVPQNKPIALAGIFTPGEAYAYTGYGSHDSNIGMIPLNISLNISAKVDGHGNCFARRILSPRQLDYPVSCKNVNDHRWVNLVQDYECPGHGWLKSQFPASFLFQHSGSVVLNDHHLWYREGPLEYPDCLFDE